uniref:thioredoxin family protein n=1 Tax=Flavobacterium sp. TaxID=239 RepID=UPI00404B4B5F
MNLTKIIQASLEKSNTYANYRKLVTDLLHNGKSTGNQQSEALTHYSSLNEVRMNRLEKTLILLPETEENLSKLKNEFIGLVITEGWCGDAAQIVPMFEKMEQASTRLKFRYVLRDENEDLMEQFLTNGSKSIPKLILMDAKSFEIVGVWGPRPEGAAKLISDYKATFGKLDETVKTNLQKWYLHDKGISIQNEVVDILLKTESN